MWDKTKIYCYDKKMFPFFDVKDVNDFINKYHKNDSVSVLKIKPESIDSSYRLEMDCFIGIYKDEDDEIRFIDQDGEAFFFAGNQQDLDNLISEKFIKI